MPGSRPNSRGARPGASARSSRPGSRPGTRPGGPRPRAQAGSRRPAPPRPRLTGRAAVLVLVLGVLMVSYASSMRAYLEQRDHLDSLRDNIADSRANIRALEREQQRWDDPAFLRAQARERFGWVLPGETAFQVIDEDGRPLGHDDSLSEPEAVTETARPLWWQSAWRSVEIAGNPEQEREVPPPATEIKAPRNPRR